MWQLKESKYPYQEIDNNDIIVYNVVKNGLRPNTVLDEFVVTPNVTEDVSIITIFTDNTSNALIFPVETLQSNKKSVKSTKLRK